MTNVEQRLVYYIHAHGSISERDPCCMQIIPHHNSLKARITPKLVTACRYLIYKHSTFLHHKIICALPNARVLCTVMVIITLQMILNEKVKLSFLSEDPIILAETKDGFHIRNVKWRRK